MWQYVGWIFYAIAHGWMVYLVCFYCIVHPGQLTYHDGVDNSGGKDLGFWVAGHVVYGGACLVCNALILMRYNNFTIWGEFLIFLMVAAYFLIFWLENLFLGLPQIYGIFGPTFSTFAIWLQLLLVVMITVIIEYGYKACRVLGYLDHVYIKFQKCKRHLKI